MYSSKLMIFILNATALFAEIAPLTGENGQNSNRHLLSLDHAPKKAAADASRKVVAFPGDTVIPHIVDGGSWSSSVTLTNLDIRTLSVTVLFFRDDGTDLVLPVAGQGYVRGMRVTLAPATTLTFSTSGGDAISSGWAYILKEDVHDAISGICVFRQSTPGRPDFEAVVPVVSQFDQRAVLLYDNTNSFVTAAAFANPSFARANVMFTVRSEEGIVLEYRSMILEPYSHWAGSIAAVLPSTERRRGSIEVVTSGTMGIGLVGLRFNRPARLLPSTS